MGMGISIGGAKDGAGKTTFALHLAYGLSRSPHKSVCLLDADVGNLGDLRTYLNVRQNKTFIEFIKASPRMDPKLAQNFIGKHPSGISLLDAASFITELHQYDDASADRAFKLLLRAFDYVVMDLGRDINPLTFRAMENSSLIFLMISSDILMVNQGGEYSKRLRSLHFGSDVQRIIVNQYDPKGVVNAQVIKQKFSIEPSIYLPDDRPALEQCLSQGKPLQILNPRHPYLKGVDEAIRMINDAEAQVDKSRVSKVGPSQPIEVLQNVIPFTFGDSDRRGKAIVEGSGVIDPALQRRLAIRARVHERLLELVDLREMDPMALEKDPKKKEELRHKTSQAIQRLLEQEAKEIDNRSERMSLHREILDEALGLGPIEQLLENPEISEIMVNGKDQIYVEQKGKIKLTDCHFTSDKQLLGAIERIVSPIGRRVDEKTPLCDARLKDGSRINIIIPPLSLRGPVITIRKFFKEKLQITDLIKFGSLTEEMADFLRSAVEARLNIVVSGGTGTGKTTLLNMVAGFIPDDERIVTVEDAAELQLPQQHVITLEARPANLQGEGAIHIRDLVRNALRMRPDRIVVGECRAGEALDMLQAMNTGHDGSLTTIHSNNPRDCIRRIETLVMMAGFDLPIQAIREQIASAVNLIVQLKRMSDGTRKISAISEVIGIEGDTIVMQPIFEFKQQGTDEKGKVRGSFMPSGLIPKFVETLKSKGIAVPKGLFARSSGGPGNTHSGVSNSPTTTSAQKPKEVTPTHRDVPRPVPKSPQPIKNPAATIRNPLGGKGKP